MWSSPWLRAVPAWAWLTAIVAGSAVFRGLAARGLPGPFIFVDELIYSELGRSFATGGRFLVRDVPTGGYGVVYPVLISPAYRVFDRLPEAYAAVKAINSVVMSLAALPAYFLARRLLPAGPSLVAALLTVAVPSMVYTGTVMTENVFYPLFLVVCLVLVAVLERPTARGQLLLLALVVASYLTRAQALAFVPALLLAPPFHGWLQRRGVWAPVRELRVLYGTLLGGGALVVAYELVRGRSLRGLLGAYAVVSDQSYDVRKVADFTLWHAADLALYVGVVPLAATVLLLARARREPGPVQAFLAAAVPVAVSFTLVVAAFATRFADDRIHERNLFQLAPLCFVGLLVWVRRAADRGVRSRIPGTVLVAAVALSPLTIPYGRFVGDPARADTLALVPVWTINRHFLAGSVLLTVGLVCGALGAILLLLPRRTAVVALPVLVLAWFALLLHPVFSGPRGFETSSAGAVFQGIQGVPRDWIDRALPAGTRVAVLWTGTSDRFTVNQNEFFNRAVGRVYFTGEPTPGGIGETKVGFDADGVAHTADGRTLRPGYLLTDGSVTPNGAAVVRDEPLGLTVWRIRGILVSMHSRVRGLYPDTWSGRTVTWTSRPCHDAGVLRVRLESDRRLFRSPPHVLARSAVATSSTRVPLTGTTDLRVRVAPRAGVCAVRFTVTPTLVPSEVTHGANGDTRRLGAHFLLFDYVPAGS